MEFSAAMHPVIMKNEAGKNKQKKSQFIFVAPENILTDGDRVAVLTP
jgi:hypothetical protein